MLSRDRQPNRAPERAAADFAREPNKQTDRREAASSLGPVREAESSNTMDTLLVFNLATTTTTTNLN